MKRLLVGIVMTLLWASGPVAAECTYQGVVYSEGARVCMYRTMYMCRGERWVKTAERCWERSSLSTSSIQDTSILSALQLAESKQNLNKKSQRCNDSMHP